MCPLAQGDGSRGRTDAPVQASRGGCVVRRPRLLLALGATALSATVAGAAQDAIVAAEAPIERPPAVQDTQEAQDTQQAPLAPPAPPPRQWPPNYQDRRFLENWTPIDWSRPHAGARDFFDEIKAIKLNDSGSAWVGFGGALRGRYAYQSTVVFGGPFDFEPSMWTGRIRAHTDLHLGKFRAFGEYIYSYSSIGALVDTLGAPEARLGSSNAPNLNGDVLNAFGEYQSEARGWEVGVWGGRRELQMGRERMLSPGNWLLNRHTFDGGGGWMGNGTHRVEGFVTRPRSPIPDMFTRQDDDTTFWGAFWTTGVAWQPDGGAERRITFEPYLLGIHRDDVTFVQGTADEDRYTIGALTFGDVGATGFDFELEGMYQWGRTRSQRFGERGTVDAWAWVAELGYMFRTVPLVPRPSISFDFASGDSDQTDTKLETFDPLFPLAWQFYGFHAAFDRKNLSVLGLHFEGVYRNTYFRSSYLPVMWRSERNDGVYNTFNAITRRPEFQSRGGDSPDLSEASRVIGQQIDVGFFWQPTQHWQFYATFAHFFAGEFWTDTQTAPKTDMKGGMLLTEFRF